jgi:hypothetical protein
MWAQRCARRLFLGVGPNGIIWNVNTVLICIALAAWAVSYTLVRQSNQRALTATEDAGMCFH